MVAFILLVIGGLNWLLIALFDGFNLVESVLGSWPMLVKAAYVLVGLSAMYELLTHKKNCALCQ